jgi:ABC-2 type transport system ATP-binding protein
LSVIDVQHISKSFETVKAVDDISFTVEPGETFGLLGPNGAGKTTMIRLILDVFRPDSGEIEILGGQMDETKKERIGYMPEERGLYQDVTLEKCLVYLGTLKGLETHEAKRRVEEYLIRFDLIDYRHKAVKSLSKGMQQKAQIILTLLHEPELVIIDEPFSGLDPVNTRMVKDLLRELHLRGVTIIMSTHQMHQVEELCDRILLMDHGRTMLYGDLNDILHMFSGHAVLIRSDGQLPDLPGVIKVERDNADWRVYLAPDNTPAGILETLVSLKVPVEHFEVAVPTLDEIFIQVVQQPLAK